MRLLVFGKTGQVARELARLCPPAWSLRSLGRSDADLANPARCAEQVRDADAVIIAAAYTSVDRAEAEHSLAETVNAATPGAIAAAAAAAGIPVLYPSTDYVFDGSGSEPWRESDPTGPLSVYGRTKFAGEEGVRAAGGQYAVLRTSWVFSLHGKNFLRSMQDMAALGSRTVRVVNDQIGGPTPAASVAQALLEMAAAMTQERRLSGTWHLTGFPDVSWADFARSIFQIGDSGCQVVEVTSADWPAPAARPLNSRLACEAINRDFGIQRASWSAALKDMIGQDQGGSR